MNTPEPLAPGKAPRAANRSKRIALLVPDGVGIRNFVLGRFLERGTRAARVDVLHAVAPDVLERLGLSGLNGQVQWHRLRDDRDSRLQEFLGMALGYAHMFWMDTEFIRLRLALAGWGATWRRRALTYAARLVGRAAASRGGITLLDRLHQRLARRTLGVRHYRALFQTSKPSVLFCSHQRPPQVLAPVLAARSLGIPTATFIFSWDNLSTKGRIAAPFDHFLVWSDLMRQELLRYYPDVADDRVHVVGTPQFDPYGDQPLLWSRADFFQRIGADPSRPLICYSGGDAGNCPSDPAYVRILMGQIRSGRIGGNPQVLLRPMPVDIGRRYDAVRTEYPELLYAQPAWVHPDRGTWADFIPLPEDVQFLANLTFHCDVNVNYASTMTLDCAIRDRPVVNVAFDVNGTAPGRLPAAQVYALLDHYRPVCELGAARLARTRDELAEHINAYLADPALDRDNRRRLVDLEVGWPIGHSSWRIVDVLEQISL